MANPIQQGLKLPGRFFNSAVFPAAMANPIQQGLKPLIGGGGAPGAGPQWLIQYNKD